MFIIEKWVKKYLWNLRLIFDFWELSKRKKKINRHALWELIDFLIIVIIDNLNNKIILEYMKLWKFVETMIYH